MRKGMGTEYVRSLWDGNISMFRFSFRIYSNDFLRHFSSHAAQSALFFSASCCRFAVRKEGENRQGRDDLGLKGKEHETFSLLSRWLIDFRDYEETEAKSRIQRIFGDFLFQIQRDEIKPAQWKLLWKMIKQHPKNQEIRVHNRVTSFLWCSIFFLFRFLLLCFKVFQTKNRLRRCRRCALKDSFSLSPFFCLKRRLKLIGERRSMFFFHAKEKRRDFRVTKSM